MVIEMVFCPCCHDKFPKPLEPDIEKWTCQRCGSTHISTAHPYRKCVLLCTFPEGASGESVRTWLGVSGRPLRMSIATRAPNPRGRHRFNSGVGLPIGNL